MRRLCCLVMMFTVSLLFASPPPAIDWAEAGVPPSRVAVLDPEIAGELADFYREVDEDLNDFRDERDRDFAEFLEEQWKEFEEFAALVPSRVPKPTTVPVAKSRPTDSVPPSGKKIEPPTPAPTPAPTPSIPEGKPGQVRLDVDFHGLPLKVFYDRSLAVPLGGAVDNHAISDYWKRLSLADFPSLTRQLERLRGGLRLNDWGYFQLVHTIAEGVQASPNEATLFAWFLLTKSGYLTKVGYNEGKVCLLVPSDHTIYQVPFFTLDGVKFYNLTALRETGKVGRLFTYQENYPGADRLVNLDLRDAPLLRTEPESKKLRFRYAGRDHEIAVTASRSLVTFFDHYPQTDLPVFFGASVSPEAEKSLLAGLRPLVVGKTETEAVNLLLRFVQTAFQYKTDDQQFGREKYLFVDETVFFPYSDCEDRSILFSFLVRRLTGLEVVGLLYPGHVATAVRFTGEVKGDQIAVGGKKYIICDPTYINADLGMAMPQFKGVAPEVIATKF